MGKYIFSVAESWGTVAFDAGKCVLSVLGSPLELNSISVPNANAVTCVTADGTDVDFNVSGGKLMLGKIKICKELCLK